MWKNRWKNEFYTRLQDVLDSRSAHTMLIVNENMKAKVGDQNWDHERAMGNHGLGEINGNGERLCETCNLNELVITGTYLPPKSIYQATWVSLDRKTGIQIDYLSIGNRYRSAEIYLKSSLSVLTMITLTRTQVRKKSRRIRYDTSNSKNRDSLRTFSITLRNI